MENMSLEQYREEFAVDRAADPCRQAMGAQNRAQGQSFEKLIIDSCELYKGRGAAFIEKTPEPMKILSVINRLKGIFKACFEKRAQPDFKGTLAGGRSICFEAKETSKERIQQSAVTPEQARDLDLHQQLDAECFVLVSLAMQNYYRVPWTIWRRMKSAFGHMYMNAEELEPYRVNFVGGYLLFLSGKEMLDHANGEIDG